MGIRLTVSISFVPQFAAPPGYDVPVTAFQSAVLGRLFAEPAKSSLQVTLKPWIVGIVAWVKGTRPTVAKRTNLMLLLKPIFTCMRDR